ncbi:MAG: DNA repair protein RecN [Clostridiales bacterium]|nr:DNA repair protein RecN [Clostridiales bacterium]
MLYELYVENFAIIRQLRICLMPGLNALSGETGAGKSLVVDAVALLIGGRGSDNFIRSGYERCVIEGVFTHNFSEELAQRMDDMGLAAVDKDDMLVLSRELVRGGRSVCRVNGRTVNLGQLRDLGRLLLNIHGQMEHMLLLEEEKQLQLLDSYGGVALLAQKEQVAALFTAMREKQKLLRDYEQNKARRDERMALLGEYIEELDAATLSGGEEETLRQEAQRLNYSEKLIGLADEAQHYLLKNGGAVEALNASAALLRQAAQLDGQAQALAERLESLYYEAEDAATEAAHYRASINTDRYRLDEIENRLALLSRLKKKYGRSLEELLAYLQEARRELAALDELVFSGGKARRALEEAETAYEQAAAELGAQRTAAALRLSAAITDELHMLCMSNATFRVDLLSHEPAAWGREKALFMIQTNAGEEFRPVAKIASGGELSRIVLAMKVILAQLDSVPTLVFDEVDSGLGGKALSAVAQRLAYVGRNTQAIVVTHAPVMAATAGRQLYVGKHTVEGRTEISVEELKGEARINELARMIAGEHISDITRHQAAELLQNAVR